MTDDEKLFEHESYGLLSFSRVHAGGTTRLFGSSFTQHPTLLQLTLRRGTMRYHGGYSRPFGREEVLRVEMSPAQFAELVSNMNVAPGVPVTIRHVNGVQCDRPPKVPSEGELIREEFELNAAGLRSRAEAGARKIDALLDTLRLPKKAKEAIQKTYREVVRFVHDGAPYLVEQFQEAAGRTLSEVKQEMDAYAQRHVEGGGLQLPPQDLAYRVMLERSQQIKDEGEV